MKTSGAAPPIYERVSIGNRDPFTIWKEKVIEAPEDRKLEGWTPPEPEVVVITGTGGDTGTVPQVDETQRIRGIVEQAYKALYSGQYDNSIKKCEEALNLLERNPNKAGMEQDRCLRILKASKKLKSRKEVEDEFEKLPIVIEGIVWRPKAGFAVINGNVRQAGEIVGGARIYKINSQDVVFIFQGLKVSKKLFEGGQQDGAKATKGRSRD
ncbi:MAG: hypothetical protein JW909_12955 [Planctomycetes bacterium]|nr:hypothetical protein [Planctomycetota bacterium]